MLKGSRVKRAAHRLKLSIAGVAIAASVVGVGGVVVVGTAIAASQTMVTTGNVNVRSGPGNTYAVLTSLAPGTKVVATGDPVKGPSSVGSTWTPVTVNGVKGYMASIYLAPVAGDSTGETTTNTAGNAVTNARVNVRTGPSLDATIVTTLDSGTALKTTGLTSGDWTQIVYDGEKRWMFSDFLTIDPSSSTPGSQTKGSVRTTANVNLRADGNINAPIMTVVPGYSIVDVTGQANDAYTQIVYKGQTGWVSNMYIKPVTVTPLSNITTLSAAQQKLVSFVKSKVGLPYVWAAEGPNSYDCSGLTMAAYRTVGISLPHHAATQVTLGTAVSRDNLQPGDLIFWYSPVSHVSMYIGNGQMVHARNTRVGVVQQSVQSYIDGGAYYAGARRFLG